MSEKPVCPFDHHSAEFAADPYRFYDDVLSAGPVVWTDAWGGFWIVSHYADITRVAKDPATFKSADGVVLPAYEAGAFDIPLNIDPPDFFPYRRLLNPLFSPSEAARAEPLIREIANELIDEFVERGECDLVEEYSSVIPARVTLRLLGMPEDNWRRYLDVFFKLVYYTGLLTPEELEQVGVDFAALRVEWLEFIREMRADPKGHNWMSTLVRADFEGRKLTEDELVKMTQLILIGGMETSGSAITAALLHLDRDREPRTQLVESPQFLSTAVDELLRTNTPIPGLARRVTRDVELGGQQLREGEWVLLLWAAGNRDPEAFANPLEVDLGRRRNAHLAFGFGIHRCLGKHLAKTEMEIAIRELLRRLPDYRVDWGGISLAPDRSNVLGYTAAPATFTPGQRETAMAAA